MRKLVLISTLGTVMGYAAVHFVFFANPKPAEQPAAVPAPAEPTMLAHVVDVTDTDALLDPLPRQPVGVPFDTEANEFTAPTAAAPIPRVAD